MVGARVKNQTLTRISARTGRKFNAWTDSTCFATTDFSQPNLRRTFDGLKDSRDVTMERGSGKSSRNVHSC